jgi:hypothetical protein
MTIEIYKDVVGYEGIYQVSNLGNVKRILISRGVSKKNNNFIKPFCNKAYYQIVLQKNGKRKYFMIHRLIAQAFIPNPNNYPFINHINGIKNDNRLENLEWCTHSQNMLHAFKTGLQIQKKGDDNKRSKKVINIETGEIYNSTVTLSLKSGIPRGTLRRWLSIPSQNKSNYRYL